MDGTRDTNSATPCTLQEMLLVHSSILAQRSAAVGHHADGNEDDSTASTSMSLRNTALDSQASRQASRFHRTKSRSRWTKDSLKLVIGDPLSDPEIPLDDVQASYTPATIEEMLQHQKNPVVRKRLRLLDLPQEIRNNIFELLLTPAEGTAMDFAACIDCGHEREPWLSHRIPRDREEFGEAIEWFRTQWWIVKRGLLSLTPVCRQIYQDATDLFYGQPFRFTGDLGWIMCYHFLLCIGSHGRARLKDVAVCHPGFSVVPTRQPELWDAASWWTGSMGWTGWTHICVFSEHLRDFRLGAMLDEKVYEEDTEWAAWQSRGRFAGPASLLARDAERLTKLTLLLPHFQSTEDQPSFADLDAHPIFDVRWRPGVKLTIAHLVSSEHTCKATRACKNHDYDQCLAELTTDRLVEDEWVACDWHQHMPDIPDQYQHPSSRKSEAQILFRKAKALGWNVTEYLHDRRGLYPVEPEQTCSNKDMCLWRWGNETADGYDYYCCPGEVETQIEHLGSEAVARSMEIWRHVPAGWEAWQRREQAVYKKRDEEERKREEREWKRTWGQESKDTDYCDELTLLFES